MVERRTAPPGSFQVGRSQQGLEAGNRAIEVAGVDGGKQAPDDVDTDPGTLDGEGDPDHLGPLHDIARQVGGRLAALLAAGSAREQLFAAFLDELDRRGRPQVAVVEDAHWADEATLDLLGVPGASDTAHPGVPDGHLPR
jgi:hypothetical protein